MIKKKKKGDFSKITKYLKSNADLRLKFGPIFKKYGEQGVANLRELTPKATGLTSRSWYYKIDYSGDTITLSFLNDNIQNGYNVAVLIQFGHGTPSGHWVAGRDYINPALKSIMESIENELWKEVTEE